VKPPLKIWFNAFWPGFDPRRNWFADTLRLRWDVTLDEHAPRVLFQTWFGRRRGFRKGTLNVFFGGENKLPDMRCSDVSASFGPDGPANYRLPLYVTYHNDPEELCTVRDHPAPFICDAVYSNPARDTPRLAFIRLLDLNLPPGKTHVAGRITRYAGMPGGVLGGGREAKAALQRLHAFSMAFENSSSPGYVTEKITEPLAAGSVPVYWGAPDVAEHFNRDRFLNAADFKNLDVLLFRMMTLWRDPDALAAISAAPVFPDGNPPPWWDRNRFLDWMESSMENKLRRGAPASDDTTT
jgi:alpha(1,3/1,4) fucosyltransferase